ncbi:PD40 domain-containing protein [Arthrobacter celericrescens]|uniref:PD40 domain-containing protein n=1 Tax=Arthrobacter celericrescens TaxID=2320851 RepID=UPI000EA25AEC|nr:PD40 domain-containing protein [Arthrobacter celericrescens]
MAVTIQPRPVRPDDPNERATAPELLIPEARQRARRRRLAIGAVAASTMALAAFAVTASLDGGPPQSQGAAVDTPAGPASFGVFEPASGRIVYSDGLGLSTIDPADPSSSQALDLPGLIDIDPADPFPARFRDLSGPVAYLVPAGWSADGTKLALTNEHNGTSYVMDAGGGLTRVPGGGGCCWFVTDPWLSPDGTVAIEVIGGDRLRLNDLGGLRASRIIKLDPPVGDLGTGIVPVTAWSPDGARIAYTAYEQVGSYLLPSAFVVDLDSGSTRQVVPPGFGHIRQMAWSPDGSRLLVIAGPYRQANPEPRGLNPLTSPKETGLYLVSANGIIPAVETSAPPPIAYGHYVAAAWSPDGAQIAAIDFAGSGRRLVVMGSDGSASRVLDDLPTNDLFTGVAWHPGPRGR